MKDTFQATGRNALHYLSRPIAGVQKEIKHNLLPFMRAEMGPRWCSEAVGEMR